MTLSEEFSLKVSRIQAEIEGIEGRAQVHGISIEVSPSGRILSLDIPSSAKQFDTRALSSYITAAHGFACADANDQARSVRAELADDPRVRQVLHRLESPTSQPPATPPPRQNDDEYFGNSSVLRR